MLALWLHSWETSVSLRLLKSGSCGFQLACGWFSSRQHLHASTCYGGELLVTSVVPEALAMLSLTEVGWRDGRVKKVEDLHVQ